jgi:hypothetical protein
LDATSRHFVIAHAACWSRQADAFASRAALTSHKVRNAFAFQSSKPPKSARFSANVALEAPLWPPSWHEGLDSIFQLVSSGWAADPPGSARRFAC